MAITRTTISRPLALAFIVALPVACGPRNFANENDTLRARVRTLEADVARLERSNQELQVALAGATRTPGAIDGGDDQVRANTPRVTQIAVTSRSHARAADDRGGDRILVYVRPVDGRGRFVQMVGTLSANVALLPEGAPARTIGSATLAPAALRDAYRSAFMGTHYTIVVPLDISVDEARTDAAAADVRVFFTDGLTGARLEASREVGLGREATERRSD